MNRDGTPPEETEYGRCESYTWSAGRHCGRAAIGEHGKCGYHGGKTDGAGAPEQNTDARTHRLHTKRDGYIERQSDDDQEWIFELMERLADMWRTHHGGKPSKAIRNRLKNIAIDMCRVAHANDHLASGEVDTLE